MCFFRLFCWQPVAKCYVMFCYVWHNDDFTSSCCMYFCMRIRLRSVYQMCACSFHSRDKSAPQFRNNVYQQKVEHAKVQQMPAEQLHSYSVFRKSYHAHSHHICSNSVFCPTDRDRQSTTDTSSIVHSEYHTHKHTRRRTPDAGLAYAPLRLQYRRHYHCWTLFTYVHSITSMSSHAIARQIYTITTLSTDRR